jgi:hypothetical protein
MVLNMAPGLWCSTLSNWAIYSGMKLFEHTGHTLDNDINKQKEALEEACKWLYELVHH